MKLRFPAGHRAQLLRHPAFRDAQAAAPRKRHEVTTYFDAPDLALARAGFSLRVRRSGGRRVQTVKADGEGDGVALRRGEWEWPVDQDTPDLRLLAETGADGALLDRIDGRLEPVFVTDIQRTACDLRLGDGTAAEAALDEGIIVAGEARQPVSELELELKRGPPGPLYRLALSLHEAAPLTILAESKAERGRRLRTGEAAVVRKASDLHLPSGVSVAGGFRRVVEACLGHLVANQAAVLAGDPAGIHQMRIAMRRLRSALVLFDAHLKRRARKRFDAELQRLGRVLGEARDWDVFCLETAPAAMQAVEAEEWTGLREAAEGERQAAHRRLQDELGGPALTGLVLAMAAESEEEPGASALLKVSARRSLLEQTPEMLDRMARRVAKRGRKLAHHSEHELHELRKSLKKQRYSIEFLGSLYGRDQVKTYVHHCKELQESLGAMNDASVAASLAQRLGEADPARLRPTAEALARWSGDRRGEALGHLAEGWREFKDAAPFWR